jgi:hypothetical protein
MQILNLSSSEARYDYLLRTEEVDGDHVDTSQLRALLLSNIRLETLTMPAKCTNLTHLVVSFNKLTDISCLSALCALELLDVSHNKISSLPTDLIQKWPLLSILKAQNNLIADIQGISHATQCTELWLSNNVIEWTQLIYLQPLSKLTSIVLHSNPASAKTKVAELVAGLCQSLKLFDGVEVKVHDYLRSADGRVALTQARQTLSSKQRSALASVCSSSDREQDVDDLSLVPADVYVLGSPKILSPQATEATRSDRSSLKKVEPVSIFKANRRRTNSDGQSQDAEVNKDGIHQEPVLEMAPLLVHFSSAESSPIVLQLNPNGSGSVRWSKKGSVACSLEDGRLFAAHKNGSIAAILDSEGNGSVSNPSGTCLLAINEKKATVFDVKGLVAKELHRYGKDTQDVDEGCRWVFDGISIEFIPKVWDLIISVSNDRLDCQFSSLTGGRVLKVKDLEKPKKPQRYKDRNNIETLATYDHEAVRSNLSSVVSSLDTIMDSLKR